MTDKESRLWAAGAHLATFAGYVVPLGNVLGPLVVYLLKKDDDPFVAAHAREALNFNLSLLVYLLVGAALSVLLIGIPLVIALAIAGLVLPILAAVKANEGEPFTYPLILRFL